MVGRESTTARQVNARRISLLAFVALAFAGCAFMSGVSDPRDTGSRNDRWEVVIAHPRASVYDVAVSTLTDSGYVLAQTNSGVSAISTADRRERRRVRLPGDPETVGIAYPIRLSLVLEPVGADSTRLSITGQYRSNNTNVTARSDDWHYVRGVGEAILARLR